MNKTILTAAFLLLTVFSFNGTPQKTAPGINPRGVYHVEIKDVITEGDVVFAPVEVGGLRILEEKPGGVLFGDVGGTANTDGPIRLQFDGYANQPLSAQLHWSRKSFPAGQKLKMIVYFRPDRDPQLSLAQLPQNDWEFTVPAPPPPPLPPPAPKIVAYTVEPNGGYINCGQSATLHWAVTGCDSNCDVTLTAKDGPSYYDLVERLPGRPPTGSMSVSPMRATLTKYFLTAANASGSDSKELVVQIHCDQKPPESAGVFCFKLTNNQSPVSTCYIVAVYDRDEQAAMKSAGDTYPGYSVDKTSCDAVCP